MLVPSNYQGGEVTWAGYIRIGGESHVTTWFSSKEEADLERRCLEKQLSYEIVKTMECEGYYPERSIAIEKLYQESGRENCLYTGLVNKEKSDI